MIDIATAEESINARVVYAGRERGVITGVNNQSMVMVRYDGDQMAKATWPKDLEFVHELGEPVRVHRELPLHVCTGTCSRRHDFIITCGCTRRFWTGKLKHTLARAQDHLNSLESM